MFRPISSKTTARTTSFFLSRILNTPVEETSCRDVKPTPGLSTKLVNHHVRITTSIRSLGIFSTLYSCVLTRKHNATNVDRQDDEEAS
ncbi:hypothetical protein HanXRQr2_Chr12g0547041 [Helianthus annuus]|uniref:Uncharacterized protein n=1 Tax=Helianthus annuus TaxID=4232 RepID=A0A251T323_HELAN|nr:hypothetical protein HanXRQr2_Chr12g0547041 [Helianthus annuus]KAJ0863142.1 hypothetical protein HanPSC8_Chr12g0526501 [Helianthus annuus]